MELTEEQKAKQAEEKAAQEAAAKAEAEKDANILQEKTEEQLREEIVEEFGFDAKDEDDKKRIDNILELRKDRYSATKAKKKAQEERDAALAAAKPAQDPSGEKPLIPVEKKAYLYASGHTEESVAYLEKVMKLTNKNAEDAQKEDLFTTWVAKNEEVAIRRGSALGASRGGAGGKGKTDDEKMVEKFSKNLPRGFSKPK